MINQPMRENLIIITDEILRERIIDQGKRNDVYHSAFLVRKPYNLWNFEQNAFESQALRKINISKYYVINWLKNYNKLSQ
jgi:hypothetical protein